MLIQPFFPDGDKKDPVGSREPQENFPTELICL